MDSLPARFKPADMARSGLHFETILPISAFERFAGLLAGDSGEVTVSGSFENRGARALAKGRLSAVIELQCQRCLESMAFDLNADFAFGFVESEEQVDQLPDDLDPVLVDSNGELSAVELLEDELILQVPARVVHRDEQRCNPTVIEAVSNTRNADPNKQNPFSDLGELLKN